MTMTAVVEGLYQVPLGISNAFLFDRPEADPAQGLTLVDTGVPGKEGPVMQALAELGRKPQDLKRILLTHGHADHIGSVGALQRLTGAEVYIGAADASIVSTGTGFRPMQPSPGLKNKVIFTLVRQFFIKRHRSVEPAKVAGTLENGQALPLGYSSLRVVSAPGHCAGQHVLLWERHGGVLIAADTCGHQGQLDLSIGYENLAQGREDLRMLSALRFEVACFGHGKPLSGRASEQFRAKFAASVR